MLVPVKLNLVKSLTGSPKSLLLQKTPSECAVRQLCPRAVRFSFRKTIMSKNDWNGYYHSLKNTHTQAHTYLFPEDGTLGRTRLVFCLESWFGGGLLKGPNQRLLREIVPLDLNKLNSYKNINILNFTTGNTFSLAFHVKKYPEPKDKNFQNGKNDQNFQNDQND